MQSFQLLLAWRSGFLLHVAVAVKTNAEAAKAQAEGSSVQLLGLSHLGNTPVTSSRISGKHVNEKT